MYLYQLASETSLLFECVISPYHVMYPVTTALSLVLCLRNCKKGNLALHACDSPVYLPKMCYVILVVSVSTKIGRPTAGMAD